MSLRTEGQSLLPLHHVMKPSRIEPNRAGNPISTLCHMYPKLGVPSHLDLHLSNSGFSLMKNISLSHNKCVLWPQKCLVMSAAGYISAWIVTNKQPFLQKITPFKHHSLTVKKT
ncbi:hypothetical protein KIL84_003393 [Mauremys mutica]|uniref:Uncharacterized protein n=1 Tax=Mauremys mutica TaxID=74926 RepID=A0A9D4ATG4_9SAUR|nr:hypothetical protein KIL84_003393 [Mauremys mutica]